MEHMSVRGIIAIMKGSKKMGKYIYGHDVHQGMMIAIPVEGSVIYPDMSKANKTIPETARYNREQVSKVIHWLQENEAPVDMANFIASVLGSKVDQVWDYSGVEIMVNNGGVFYTLKNVQILDGIENVLKMKDKSEVAS